MATYIEIQVNVGFVFESEPRKLIYDIRILRCIGVTVRRKKINWPNT